MSADKTPEPTQPDPRACGWLGCGHPRCEPFCAGVPLDEYLAWREGTASHERPCCPGAGTMAHVRGCRNHPETDGG